MNKPALSQTVFCIGGISLFTMLPSVYPANSQDSYICYFVSPRFAFNNTDHRGRDCVIISNTKKYSEPCEARRPRICERKALRLSSNP